MQLYRLAERLVVHIAYDSNNRFPRSVHTPTNALSDGILARPELPPRRLAYEYQLKEATGILVVSLQDGSPASRAGLRDGDIVTAIAGQPVAGIDALHHLLTAERAGIKLSLEVLRGVERLDLSITPETKPED